MATKKEGTLTGLAVNSNPWRDELNASFDKLSETALKVKRDRDALLAAAKLSLAGLMNPKMIDFDVLEEELRNAIAEAENK